jgi:hypothetical protein
MVTATSGGQEVGRRVALVIGNAAYRRGPPLANPTTDAAAISEALRRLDFDPVEQYLDLDKSGHDKALKQFAGVSKKADMAVVYYAGHGMELDGENYLLPIDAELTDVAGLAFETTRLSDLMHAVDGANRFRFVILDACRDNPFRRQMQGLEATRSGLSRGLAVPPDFSGNMLVAYAAKHGTQAKDGKKGSNSPFAAAFLKHIETPNTDIRLIIGRIRDDVLVATENVQDPAFYGSMGGTEVQLKHVASIPTPPPISEESSVLVKALEEERDWEKAQRTDTIAGYEDFGRQWASGRFVEDARHKIEGIRESQEFTAAKKEGIDGLRAFLARWPDGARKDDAQKILDELGAEAAWETRVKAMVAVSGLSDDFSADVLRDFAREFPASNRLAEVQKRLEAVEAIQATDLDKSQVRATYERYLKNWPHGAKREHATRLLEGGGDDRLWIDVQKEKTVALLERYVKEWPKGRHAEEAAKLLPSWKFREKRNEWATMGYGLILMVAFAIGVLGALYGAGSFAYGNFDKVGPYLGKILGDILGPFANTRTLPSSNYSGLDNNHASLTVPGGTIGATESNLPTPWKPQPWTMSPLSATDKIKPIKFGTAPDPVLLPPATPSVNTTAAWLKFGKPKELTNPFVFPKPPAAPDSNAVELFGSGDDANKIPQPAGTNGK